MNDTPPKNETIRIAALIAGLIVFVVILLLPTPEGMSVAGQRTAAVAALMSIWWIFEAIPIPATALLPLALFPALSIIPAKTTAMAYGDQTLFLFAGGFFIAMAMQKWNLHERIALAIIHRVGTRGPQLILGFMVATAMLSMWISNTATTLMMMPIAGAVIASLAAHVDPADERNFAVALLLGTAYAASIGGIATLVGTPPNIVFIGQMSTLFPEAPDISFARWLCIGMPLTAIMLPFTWFILTKVLHPIPKRLGSETFAATIDARRLALGPMSRGEITVAIVASMTGICWMIRNPLMNFIHTMAPAALPEPSFIHDSTIAMFFAILLFAIPVDRSKNEYALDWEWAQRIPWGILLLFGGGLALASGFKETGLIYWLGERLSMLDGLHPILVIASICFLVTFLTELTSNVATATILLPILAITAIEVLDIDPLLLMIPATISASCAFMLPVATPPNAIAFAGGQLSIFQMARAGLILNLFGIIVITTLSYFLIPFVFGSSFDAAPSWAQSQP